jgi:hypothetical protein
MRQAFTVQYPRPRAPGWEDDHGEMSQHTANLMCRALAIALEAHDRARDAGPYVSDMNALLAALGGAEVDGINARSLLNRISRA